jgi:hypothetical protein
MTNKTPSTPPVRRGTILRVIGFSLLGLIILIGLAAYLLLGYSPVPKTTSYQIDMARIRALAVEGGQPLPVRLNALIIAEGAYPSSLVVAGTGMQNIRMTFPTFQIVYLDGSSIVVDTPHTQAMHAEYFPGMPYYPKAYAQMQAALTKSKLILATHEHFDHLGGLAAAPNITELLPKARLTGRQIANIGPEIGFTTGLLESLPRLTILAMRRPRPGWCSSKPPGTAPAAR